MRETCIAAYQHFMYTHCKTFLQAEALKERSSFRVKLNIVICAPLLIIPYTPTTSPLSTLSLTPLPHRAFVANLGQLVMRNVFKFASDVAAAEGKEMDRSSFLSPSGLPAVVDCLTVTISSVQLGRYTHQPLLKQLWSVCMYIVPANAFKQQ